MPNLRRLWSRMGREKKDAERSACMLCSYSHRPKYKGSLKYAFKFMAVTSGLPQLCQ
jgi:hypothetical protein